MAFRTLFDAGYAAYLDENGDCGDLWFFLHIPKTAGSSFRSELAELLKPNHNVHAYDGSDDDFATRRGRAIRSFAIAVGATRFRFASGHVPVAMMGPILNAARAPKVFTMVRDPVARVISDFRYQSTPQHPDHEAFRARCPSIEAYLDLPGERDKMMRFLAPHPHATVEETSNFVLDNFAFVGSMETYATSFAVMMDLLEADRSPSLFLRKTEPGRANDVALTPTLAERIRSVNAGDVALYERLMVKIRQVEHLRTDLPRRLRRAPEQGFSAWREV